jgi:hypothetical protein
MPYRRISMSLHHTNTTIYDIASHKHLKTNTDTHTHKHTQTHTNTHKHKHTKNVKGNNFPSRGIIKAASFRDRNYKTFYGHYLFRTITF